MKVTRTWTRVLPFIPRRNASNLAYEVFDRNVKRIQRQNAASDPETSRKTDYIREAAALSIAERLTFISRKFPRVMDLGSGPGTIERIISDLTTPDSRLIQSRLGKITMVDSASNMLERDADPSKFPFNHTLDIERIVCDEEHLDLSLFPDESFDAVISSLSLHWINDLPGVLNRINNLLVPDGMFMGAMIGDDSLYELRTSLQLAELERFGRITSRVSPMVKVSDLSGILQQAKFQMVTVDVEDVIVSYPDIFSLMTDLQAMGESNAIKVRAATVPRDVLYAAEEIYKALHKNEDGSLPASFRILYMIGWKYSPDQPQPLERGSGDISLKDVLSVDGKK